MHSLSEAYGLRPSSLLDFETEWAAYQYDEACLMAGRAAELAAVENSSQQTAFGGQKFAGNGKRKFKPMREHASKKVRVRNGVW